MAQPAVETRTELTLERIARSWSYAPRGREYVRALSRFLSRYPNPHTLRSYSFAVLELFEWEEVDKGRISTPDKFDDADAEAFADWLLERPADLTRFRLSKDPERELDEAVFDYLASHTGASVQDVRRHLLAKPRFTVSAPGGGRALRIDVRTEKGLGGRMALLVQRHTLARTPTLEQVRRGEVPIAGWSANMYRDADITYPVPEDVWRYGVARPRTKAGVDRAGNVTARLIALHSLWSYLASPTNDRGPLLAYNIWQRPLARAREMAGPVQSVYRRQTTPDSNIVVRLLATTFTHLVGPTDAVRLAGAALGGTPVRSDIARSTLSDLRDRALLLFMIQAGGPRVSEVSRIERSHLDTSGAQALVTIYGKRRRVRQVVVPASAAHAFAELDQKLRELAEHQRRYGRTNRAEKLLRPSAPLFPAIKHWGANRDVPDDKPLGRPGIAMMLRRRANRAGVDDASAEMAQIHPHGLRHLFAQLARESGTDVAALQAMMGHASIATTGRYIEERRPDKLIAEAFRPRAATPVEALPQVVRTMPRVIEQVPPRAVAPAEAPQAAPPVEGLVAVGAPPELPSAAELTDWWAERTGSAVDSETAEELAECAAEEEEALARLCAIYELDWGERGHRERLVARGEAMRELERSAASASLEAALFGDVGEEEVQIESLSDSKRLTHTYVGDESGLIWWDGTSGRLDEPMPVLSPGQIGDCGPDEQSDFCEAVVELWTRWQTSGEPGRGPTAAAALTKWVAEALESTAQVQTAIDARGGHWVESHDEWRDTAEQPSPPMAFREHMIDDVMDWFERHAWQHRVSRGRTTGSKSRVLRDPKVADEPWQIPDWYQDPDPVADLPLGDRAELLDLMTALTGGYQLSDETRRWGSLSRRDAAQLIETMVRYDELRDQIRDAKQQGDRLAEQRLAEAAAAQADEASELARRHGVDLDLPDRVRNRVKTRLKQRESRSDFYQRTLAELFGPEVGADPMLALVADRARGPLATPDHQALLAPDLSRGTITHDPDYARSWARSTGTSSECVARRTARHLWELWRARNAWEATVSALSERAGVPPKTVARWLSGQPVREDAAVRRAAAAVGVDRRQYENAKAFDRRGDTVDLVSAMAAARVPCPASQESQLQRYLEAGVAPVYDRWAAAAAGERPEERERSMERSLQEEVLRDRNAWEATMSALSERDKPVQFSKNPLRLPTGPELVLAVMRPRRWSGPLRTTSEAQR